VAFAFEVSSHRWQALQSQVQITLAQGINSTMHGIVYLLSGNWILKTVFIYIQIK
jgi:hypothetical protein